MSFSKEYHCLVAGLPELLYDDRKVALRVESLRDMLFDELGEQDLQFVRLYFGRYDNLNLLAYLKNSEAVMDSRGTLSAEDFEEIVDELKEGGNLRPSAPGWFGEFVTAWFDETPLSEELSWEDQLTGLYYDFLLRVDNPFFRDYFTFELDLGNILSALMCRKFELPATGSVVGNSLTSNAIRQSQSRDFGLAGEVPFLDPLQRITEETNLLERERKVDLLRWSWLDENIFFHYFTVEKLFSVLIKLEIVERWLKIDPEFGKERFRQLLDGLQSSYEFPEEYKRKK